jgi:hypothetical protein
VAPSMPLAAGIAVAISRRRGAEHVFSHKRVITVEDAAPPTEIICPVGGQTMTLLRRIRSAFGDDTDVFQCKSRKFSTTYFVKK